MIQTIADAVVDREAAVDLAVQRLIAAVDTGYLPLPRAFRADLGMVAVEVRQVTDLANWRLYCHAQDAELTTKTTLDVTTNLWVTRTWFATRWNEVEFQFGFTCPADGAR